jgi:L-lactate dehydrogenase complex protein LldF
LPRLLVDLRADQVEDGRSNWFDKQAMQGFLFAMRDRGRYEQAGKLANFGTNIIASLSGGHIKTLPPPLSAWTNSRDFPAFAKKSFRDQWNERLARRKTVGS